MTGYVLSVKGLEKIERKRQELAKTQEQIGWDTCLSRATVSKVIQGDPDKPLHLSSLRRLFAGLSLILDDSDYYAVDKGTSTKGIKLDMSDRNDLIKAAEKLEAQADQLEAEGKDKKATELRESAANLRRIATQ